MKIALRQYQRPEAPSPPPQPFRFKQPKEAFQVCPGCKSKRILDLGDDTNVFCGDCDWDSMNIYAELFAKAQAYQRHSRCI